MRQAATSIMWVVPSEPDAARSVPSVVNDTLVSNRLRVGLGFDCVEVVGIEKSYVAAVVPGRHGYPSGENTRLTTFAASAPRTV